MIISHILNSCTGLGGVEIIASEKLIGFKNKGHEVYCITFEKGLAAKFLEDASIEIKVVKNNQEIINFVKSKGIQILHGHSAIGGSLATDLKSDLPNVVCGEMIHSVAGGNKKADFEVVHTKYVQSIRPDSTFIPWGVDIKRITPTLTREEARARYNIPPGAFVIGRAGRLVGSKLPDHFVECLARLPKPIWAILAGHGEFGDELHRIAQRLGCLDRLRFTGMYYNPGDIYVACDLVVYPTHDESLGAFGFESGYQSLPLVAYLKGGMSDYCIPEKTCLEANSPIELTKQVMRIIQDPSLGVKLGTNLFNKCTEIGYYDLEADVLSHLALYERCLNETS